MEGRDWPLVGREEACHRVRAVLNRAPPFSLVIAGPPGVGKTRLAREALAEAERMGRPTSWAAATEAASLVPLGALAHLLPPLDGATEPLVLLDRAFHAIADAKSHRPPVLGVDDVHLLDQLSTTLIHRLAASGAVSLVLTVRSGEDFPDPAAPLWKDGLATRMDLQGLPRGDASRVLAQVLGGPVDSRTDERVWRLTRGNPLYLREILAEGQRTQQIHEVFGLWRWDGPMTPSPRLCALVRDHLGRLNAEEWQVLEMLSMTEPLTSRELIALSSPRVVASLERRGLATEDSEPGTAGELRIAHPVHAAVVRVGVSEATLRLFRQQLSSGAVWPRTPEQLVRRAVTLVDDDLSDVDPEALVEAARRALAAHELAAAERLARSAAERGAGVASRLVLVEAVRWLGEPARSESLATLALEEAGADSDRAALVVARLLSLLATPGREAEARTSLAAATAAAVADDARALLVAADAVVALREGNLERAMGRSSAARRTTPAGSTAHLLATAVQAVGYAWQGQTIAALAAVDDGRAALAAAVRADERLFAEMCLLEAEALALYLAGRLDELDRRSGEFRLRTLRGPEWAGDALSSFHCGFAAFGAGRLRDAMRWLVEADVLLGQRDPYGLRTKSRAVLALSRALSSELTGTESLSGEPPDGRWAPALKPMTVLAQADVALAKGASVEARRLVLRAAALARARGQHGLQAFVMHESVRLGMAAMVAGPLRQLADRLDAPLVGAWAVYAEAAATGDARQLEKASGLFEQLGALHHAADAAEGAAGGHERHGARRAAAADRTRATLLRRQCGLENAVPQAAPLPTLTLREEEVALLAIRGLSNQGIADRLVVSVRTVETHLSHIYAKFGITSRAELVTALEAATSAGAADPGPRDLAGVGAH